MAFLETLVPLAASALPGLVGGTKTNVTQSSQTSVSALASPVISIVTGSGTSRPSSSPASSPGGSASADGTLTGEQFPGQASLFGSLPSPSFSSPVVADISEISGGGGALGKLFDDPLMLVLLAGGAFLAFTVFGGK